MSLSFLEFYVPWAQVVEKMEQLLITENLVELHISPSFLSFVRKIEFGLPTNNFSIHKTSDQNFFLIRCSHGCPPH